jgi:thioredoxin
MAMATIELTDENFEETLTNNDMVVIDFWADWCGPCKILEPILNSVSAEYNEGEFSLTKLEAEDENMKIAGQFSVRGFPTVIAFIRGKEVARFHSAQTHDFVRDFIDQNLQKF